VAAVVVVMAVVQEQMVVPVVVVQETTHQDRQLQIIFQVSLAMDLVPHQQLGQLMEVLVQVQATQARMVAQV
jgi:hypothetical protein